jgi:hypothetical protein
MDVPTNRRDSQSWTTFDPDGVMRADSDLLRWEAKGGVTLSF